MGLYSYTNWDIVHIRTVRALDRFQICAVSVGGELVIPNAPSA